MNKFRQNQSGLCLCLPSTLGLLLIHSIQEFQIGEKGSQLRSVNSDGSKVRKEALYYNAWMSR